MQAADNDKVQELLDHVEASNNERQAAEQDMLLQESVNESLTASLQLLRDRHQEQGHRKTVALIDAVLMLCEANVRLRFDMWEKLSHLCQVQMEQKSLNEHEKQHIFCEANLDVSESAIYNKAKHRAFAPQRPYCLSARSQVPRDSRTSLTSATSSTLPTASGPMTPSMLTVSSSLHNLTGQQHSEVGGLGNKPSKSPTSQGVTPVSMHAKGVSTWEDLEVPSNVTVVKSSLSTIQANLPSEHVPATEKTTSSPKSGRRSRSGDHKFISCLDKVMVTLSRNSSLLSTQSDQIIFTISPIANGPFAYEQYRVIINQGKIELFESAFEESIATISLLEMRVNPSYPLEIQVWKPKSDLVGATQRESSSSGISVRYADEDKEKEEASTSSCMAAEAEKREGKEKKKDQKQSNGSGSEEQHANASNDTNSYKTPKERELSMTHDYVGSTQVFVSQLHRLALSPIHLRRELMVMRSKRGGEVTEHADDHHNDGIRRVPLSASPSKLLQPIPKVLPPQWETRTSRDGTPFLANVFTDDTAWCLEDILFGVVDVARAGEKEEEEEKKVEKLEGATHPPPPDTAHSSSNSDNGNSSNRNSKGNDGAPGASTTDADDRGDKLMGLGVSPSPPSPSSELDPPNPNTWLSLKVKKPLPRGGVLVKTVWDEHLRIYVNRLIALSVDGSHRYAVSRESCTEWCVLNAEGFKVPIAESSISTRGMRRTPRPLTPRSNRLPSGLSSSLKQRHRESKGEEGSDTEMRNSDYHLSLEKEFQKNPPLPLVGEAVRIERVILRRREQPYDVQEHAFGFDGEWEPEEAKRIRDNLLKMPLNPNKSKTSKLTVETNLDSSNSAQAARSAVLGQSHSSSSSGDVGSRVYPFDYPNERENIQFGGEEKSRGIRTVRCATLDKLIEMVTHPHFPPANIRTVFLLMYHSFTTARELLARLVSRYFMPTPMNMVPDELRAFQTTQQIVRLRVKNLVKHWINAHYTDFQDDEILKQGMHDFLVLIGYNKIRALEEGPRELLESKVDILKSVLPPSVNEDNWDFSFTGSREHNVETARQLSLMAFEEYQKIRMRDVLDKIFEGKENVHIRNLIDFFNNMSKLVQHTIVSEPKLKQRVLLFGKFAFIAWECRAQNNFLMSYAISAALGSNPIYRLKKTKEQLGPRTLEKIEKLNELYAKAASSDLYRMALKHAVTNPCVPYIGTTLHDLTFTHDGNKDTVCGMVNFSKRVLMFDSIQQLDQFQKKRYLFEPVPFIQEQLRKDFKRMESDEGKEEVLYTKSLEVEPREAS